ncbi:unnamed protein product [Thelazia callipaeda]|uniref:Uncharacterized protein n=1 Tax=Thelazia callipaeda TaxID=103827 RepID=A0A0N5CMS5_THECL|nr:unnamed protein product [Thelazia callipaeda]
MKSKERFLSPSLLSFYNDESTDSIADIPKLLEKAEITEKDREAILEMIMDISGAKKAVEFAMDLFDKRKWYGLEDKFFEVNYKDALFSRNKRIQVTQRLADVFKLLEQTLNKHQTSEINSKGFTFMEVEQYKKMLAAHGTYYFHGVNNTEEIEVELSRYKQLDGRKREESLWNCIETIARNNSQIAGKRRRRDLVSIASPFLLSPYMFSPVFGLTILGPVVLSPNIFSPLVFNPSLVSPFVLDPAIAMPFVISPYILSPYVLTPMVMAPFILNPYILSPNVLTPYVLSPVVLSPYILCPDVLSPQVLGGAILSPSVFSPAVGTESFLMANILSPTWMS